MVVATYFYYEKVHRTMQLQLYQTSLLDNSLIDSLVLQVAGVTGKASNPPHLKWLKKTLPFLAEKTFFVEYILI